MGRVPDSLRVRVLGGLAVDGLTDSELGSRKARSLLKVLVLARGAPVSTATLHEVLWTGAAPARAGDLAVLVSRLRRSLGTDRFERSESGYSLRVDWLDVSELAALVEESAGALRDGRVATARAAATTALSLVRGPLLPDDEGAWVEAARATAHSLAGRARGLAAAAALRSGDHLAAELAAEAALAHDPYDEDALRILMQARAGAGRSASALAAYARMRDRLAEDLGVSPSAETEAVHTSLLLDTTGARPERPRFTLVGRGAEMSFLVARRPGHHGPARVVLVSGDAGIGKTSLVQQYAEDQRAAGVRIWMSRADEFGRDLPLQPVLDAVRPDRSAAAVDVGSATVLPDAAAERVRLFEELLHRLVAGALPTVLVVDDVHWADGTTVEWLRWVQGRDAPLLVVAVSRPGTIIGGAEALTVGPLDAASIGRLVRDAGGRAGTAVHERSGGNPLFALALASVAGDELPATVQQAIGGTFARLDPTAQDVLRAGAALGAEVDVDLLAGVLGLPALQVVESLEHAAALGLIVERGAGFAFRHAIVREAIAATTGAARVALLHREAAQILDRRPVRDPLGVAVHARLGGAHEIAGRAFLDAAAVSFSRSDLVAAEAQLRASLEAADTADAHQALARVLMVSQRLDAAASEAEQAVAAGGGAGALEVAGWIDYYRRRSDAARRFADEAAVRAPVDSPIHASALALGGRVRHGSGDLQGAEERLRGALTGPPGVRSVAEVWLGQLRVHEGRPAEALDLIEHALIDPEHIAHPFAPIHGRFARVLALGQLGRVTDALRACDDLRDAIRRAGAVGARFPATELNARAWLLRGTGSFDRAAELNLEAIESNRARDGSGPASEGLAEAYWVAWLDLADGHLACGDADAAASVLARVDALDTWNGTMAWHQRHRLGLQRARVARAAGNTALAAELAASVQRDAARRGTPRYEALAHLQLALAGGDGDHDRIERSVDVLRGCAALELPPLLLELGSQRRDERWSSEGVERRRALSAVRPSP